MTRKTFLSLTAAVAVAVGTLAVAGPGIVLASKGVGASAAGELWARELGIALIAVGVMAFLVRSHPDSPTLRAFLIGMAVLQLGLFPIEIIAYTRHVITNVWGIVPNSVLHAVLAFAFAWYAVHVVVAAPQRSSSLRR